MSFLSQHKKGVIQLEDEDDIFIEPVQDHVLQSDGKHPHVVYRRAAVKPEGPGDDSQCEEGRKYLRCFNETIFCDGQQDLIIN